MYSDVEGGGTVSTITAEPIVIRRAQETDADALRRLAQLDRGLVPAGDVLVAEVGGEIRAALGIATREFIADPFYPSRDLVGLLDMRAARLRSETLSRTERIRARLSQWSHLWWRAAQLGPTQ